MRNLRNMNMDDVFGQMKGMPKMPGMGGMGGMGMPAGLQEAMAQLPRGFTPPGFQAPRPAGAKPNQQSAKDKKDKRKAQKAARKKSRR
jgi:hypothetical protein